MGGGFSGFDDNDESGRVLCLWAFIDRKGRKL